MTIDLTAKLKDDQETDKQVSLSAMAKCGDRQIISPKATLKRESQ